MKVIVAMSGGVDSSVVAYLLKKEGHDVIGLSFELWDKRDLASSSLCCSVETINLAQSVARQIGIEHYTVDVRDTFYTHVIESFCESYVKGTTPNPCILCNKYIKFDSLLKKASELGADCIATGHYARVTEQRARNGEQRFLLKKGIDHKKDQSYVLYVMSQDELSKTIFPVGEFTKDRTRSIAEETGLATATRPESQEICFVGDDNYTDYIKGHSPDAVKAGQIVDMDGKVLGEHKGIAFYTIGQRKGLGISSPVPRYVADIHRESNTIVVGSRDDATRKKIQVTDLNWIAAEFPVSPERAGVKIRSTMHEVMATVTLEGENVLVEFDEPQWAPAPGQSAVFYRDDIVLGGGIIL
ncbi:MAG: tRNA 2-thiouridine(34) synthase MnmA [Nitrospiraceae bacterium]|nr:MAG: tRNA 2-thiouridine(34) synthase MnmA [Nitrospiraceae bacterium]